MTSDPFSHCVAARASRWRLAFAPEVGDSLETVNLRPEKSNAEAGNAGNQSRYLLCAVYDLQFAELTHTKSFPVVVWLHLSMSPRTSSSMIRARLEQRVKKQFKEKIARIV